MTSLSFIVGLIVTSVLTVVGLTLFVIGRRIWVKDLTDDSGFFGAAWMTIGGLLAVVTLGVSAWAFYPYDMQYHRYKHVEGTVVAAVEARMLADGKATTQKYAVRFVESGDTYRCDDTRCSLLKQGDFLALWCIREWQYASTPGWDCNFDSSKPGGAK